MPDKLKSLRFDLSNYKCEGHLNLNPGVIFYNVSPVTIYYIFLTMLCYLLSECAKHCSICYNETECYECTQGFYLDENGECKRK